MEVTATPEASTETSSRLSGNGTMEQLGQFRILGKIGAGGMGEVYRAHDEKLQRDVAVKVLGASQFADATARARLIREARSAAGLNHPNICVIHEVGESEGQAYIAMECVEGESLSARIARSPLSPSDVIRFGIQLADALAHAHARNIVHRDLKPANIIITPEQRLKVLDFGLAKRVAESSDPGASTDVLVTAHGVISGTPAYISPEQLRGLAADERSDIWAMGVILYEMASGKRPFEGNTWPELSAAILASPSPTLPEGLSPELDTIIRRCLEKEPGSRYQKAIEVRSALEIIQSTVGLSRPLPIPKPRRRWGLIAAAAAVLAVALAAGLNRERIKGWFAAPPPAAKAAAPGAVQNAMLTVAVLPFSNFSGGDEEYLADGMQDAVIGELARVKELRVISRTSTLGFRKSGKSAAEIAKALGADNLVEGSVVHAGDRVRVQIKLIRTVPEEHQVWADAFERDMRDVLSLYSAIAGAVATQIDSRLSAAAKTEPVPQVNPEIYKLYLRGMYQVHKGGEEGFKAGIALMQQAIEMDPADPLGYTGLAQAYALRVHDGLGTPEDLALAKAAAQKAASTESPALAEVYGSFGLLNLYDDWDSRAAEKNFKRAIDLNPSLSEFRRQRAWSLMTLRRQEEALAEMRRAHDTEPLEAVLYADIAWILLSLGRVDEAIPEARKAVELQPDIPYILPTLGIAYAKKGMFKEALEIDQRVLKIDPSFRWALARTLVMAGRTAEAQPIIEQMKKDNGPAAAYGLAVTYCALGNKDEAIRWAGVARERRFIYAQWFGVDEGLALIHDDPRFKKILASMNLS